MRDESVIIGAFGLLIGKLGGNDIGPGDAGKQGRLQGVYVVGQRRDIDCHDQNRIITPMVLARFFCGLSMIFRSLSGRFRAPRMLRIPPVDRLEQIAHLCRRQRNHPVYRLRPNKLSTVQTFGIK